MNTAIDSTVQIARKGAVRAPVDVRVTLMSGAQQLQTWDGQAASLSLSFPANNPIMHVEVDPARKLTAELNRVDNSIGTWRMLLPFAVR